MAEKELILYYTQGLIDNAYELQKLVERLKEFQEKLSGSGAVLAFAVQKVIDGGYQNTCASEEELGEALAKYISLVDVVKDIRRRLRSLCEHSESRVKDEVTEMVNKIAKYPRK